MMQSWSCDVKGQSSTPEFYTLNKRTGADLRHPCVWISGARTNYKSGSDLKWRSRRKVWQHLNAAFEKERGGETRSCLAEK